MAYLQPMNVIVNMKPHLKLRVLAAWVCLASAAIASPPQSVAGMTFIHTVYTGLFDSKSTQILLNSDGTYTGLTLRESRTGSVPGGAQMSTLGPILVDISIPGNGTWGYRVIDQATAEITLDGRAMRLHFTADLTGRSGDLIPNQIAPYFTLAPYIASARLANCSTLGYVAPSRSILLGFVIAAGERRILVRAVGSSLRTFGVTQPLENPRLVIRRSGSSLPVDYDLPLTTRATLIVAAQRAGAFPLTSPNDQERFLTLSEGAYTAEVSASSSTASGEVLIEVYQLP